MKLYCTGRYVNTARGLGYTPGPEPLDVSEELGRYLLADAPGCFATEPTTTGKAPEQPPLDKMVRTAGRKKAASE